MTNLVNHPGFWLSPEAAASLERLEAAHGVITVNSAGRTVAEQQHLIDRYFVIGGPANRPPNLFAPYRPAAGGNHVKNGGQAVDTPNIAHMLQFGPEFGWYQNFAYDPVHFEYDRSRDKHFGGKPVDQSSALLAQEQLFLNQARGHKLRTDGILDNDTVRAITRYQTFLRDHYGYKGALDGKWGAGTQAAHSVYYQVWEKNKTTMAGRQNFLNVARGHHIRTDGIVDNDTTRAIKRYQQFLTDHYKYTGKIDGKWGKGTQAAHQRYYMVWETNKEETANQQTFLNVARGHHIRDDGLIDNDTVRAITRYQTFLRDHYGYKGALDGKWSDAVQEAHDRYYAVWAKQH